MKREDFHKGQTVYVYLVGNAARYKKTIEERIEKWTVVSVGRKYLTAKNEHGFGEERFDMENDFRHVHTYGSASYILYLSEEDLRLGLWREKTINSIQECTNWSNRILNKLSDEELKTVYDIFSKYMERNVDK